MRYENTVQWAIAAQLGDVYRGCANATSVDQLIEHLQGPLATWLGIDVITLALAEQPSVVVASARPLTPTFIERIQAHGARCIEGKGKTARSAEDIVVQQVGTVTEVSPIEEETNLLWTGALESAGRLVAVITFYRSDSHKVSPLELTALRQIRSLISDTIIRIFETNALNEMIETKSSSDPELPSDVVVIAIKDVGLISQAFGSDRVLAVQNEIIARMSVTQPEAFLIARLGTDRIIVINHPGNGMTIEEWTSECTKACKEIEVAPGVALEIQVEIGEVDGTAEDGVQSNTVRDIDSPSDVGLDVLAG